MNLKIQIRYAVLITLLMLLWLSLEYMIGLQDEYVAYHPYVTMLALIIPVYGIRKALKDIQDEEPRPLPFRQAFMIGFIITIMAAVLSIPTQLIFHQLINPDFFQNMKDYAVKHAAELNEDVEKAKRTADLYFNLSSYILQAVIGTLISGTLISLALAWYHGRKRR